MNNTEHLYVFQVCYEDRKEHKCQNVVAWNPYEAGLKIPDTYKIISIKYLKGFFIDTSELWNITQEFGYDTEKMDIIVEVLLMFGLAK